MKKILFISPYPFNKAPSQRFRFEQYLEFFEENGFEITLEPFLGEKTWKILFSQGNYVRKFIGGLKGILNRLRVIGMIHKFDLIFIHREASFIGPAIFEKIYAKLARGRIIYDFDDAIWLLDVSEENKSLSWLKKPMKASDIIKLSAHVICGNNFLASFAKQYNPNVTVIPTTIDTNYHLPCNKILRNTTTIGWTGTNTTIKHFNSILPVFEKLYMKLGGKVKFALISNKPVPNPPVPLEYIPWSKDSEIEDLCKFDIGIMPLPDNIWAKGKCGFKGLQYMALEIPTVMSPVGVNTEIISDGINGFLASTEEEWIEKLSLLVENPDLREKFGKMGRQTVVDKYSVESQKERYLEVFNKVLAKM